MPVTGELIRLQNYIDDIATTLRKITATIPFMTDEERKQLAFALEDLVSRANNGAATGLRDRLRHKCIGETVAYHDCGDLLRIDLPAGGPGLLVLDDNGVVRGGRGRLLRDERAEDENGRECGDDDPLHRYGPACGGSGVSGNAGVFTPSGGSGRFTAICAVAVRLAFALSAAVTDWLGGVTRVTENACVHASAALKE